VFNLKFKGNFRGQKMKICIFYVKEAKMKEKTKLKRKTIHEERGFSLPHSTKRISCITIQNYRQL
jgi:hypothetical protein